MHKVIEYRAGATIEVVRCYPVGYRKNIARDPVPKKTKEEIREANKRQAARKLERKINANFRPGDWHVILTYREKPSPEEAQKRLKKFLESLRSAYKKRGYLFKYVTATEYKARRIHHHIILNDIDDGAAAGLVRKNWKDTGNPKYVQLYDSGEYGKLADYLIKETERTFRETESPVKQRYSCSRNLVEPKKKEQDRMSAWKREPKPRKGYYILPESVFNGHDRVGYPYQRYIMVKIKPEASDWPSCRIGGGKKRKDKPPSGNMSQPRKHRHIRLPEGGRGKEKS